MTPAGLQLLALGLVLGLVIGGAVVAFVSRRSKRPKVILKITPDALPPRASRSAGTPVARPSSTAVPVHGGSDPGLLSLTAAGSDPLSGEATGNGGAGGVLGGAGSVTGGAGVVSPGTGMVAPGGGLVAVLVGRAAAPAVSAVAEDPDDARRASDAASPGREIERMSTLDETDPLAGEVPARGTALDAALSDGGPCSGERRALTERTAIALRAREVHRQAVDTLRAAQRAYDEGENAMAEATRAVDGRQVLERKRAAQQRFHRARSVATSQAEVEEAATAWLADINELNLSVRDARSILELERLRAARLLVELEQASGRVDGARIAAESAEEDVRRARQALADCQEEHLGRESAVAFAALAPATTAGGAQAAGPGVAPVPVTPGDLGEGPASASPSVLVRILRGDRALLGRVVAVLAAGSAEEAQRWERELGALVDAIVQAAVDDSAIELPAGNPFWSTFTEEQALEIARALGSLGYRYDGRGGFLDGRLPSMRDLSLAIGYTGLDSTWIRIWPTEAEMAQLYEGAHVAADRFLVTRAPDLTLGQMIALLGRAAEALTPVWDEWGRVRPLLASTAP